MNNFDKAYLDVQMDLQYAEGQQQARVAVDTSYLRTLIDTLASRQVSRDDVKVRMAIDDLLGLRTLLNQGQAVAPTPMTIDLAITALSVPKREWISVNERPFKTGRYFVHINMKMLQKLELQDFHAEVETMYYSKKHDAWSANTLVTHWMPLPEPPRNPICPECGALYGSHLSECKRLFELGDALEAIGRQTKAGDQP